MADSIKHPLFDYGVEQALIGSMLADTTTISIARAHVEPTDFYDEAHQLIVQLIFDFDEEGRAVTPITLNSWVKHNPAVQQLNKIFGEDLPPGMAASFYLGRLALDAPALPNVSAYAASVADLAQRRGAVWALGEAQDEITAREKGTPAPILLALAPVIQIADDIAEKQMGVGVSTLAIDRGHATLRQIEEQVNSKEEFGVQTLLEPLDKLIGGLYPENLVIVAGRPGMGKSILACYLLMSAARQSYAADYWSVEMPSREVMARILCDIDYDLALKERYEPMQYRDIVRMKMDNTKFERAALANQQLLGLNINIIDRNRVRMGDIVSASRARAARSPNKRRLIVIDHLHILQADDRYRGNRVNELSEMTAAAKRLSRQISGTVVLLSQLSRDIEKRDDKRPQLSDLRDSGSIEQDADAVLGLYRGQYYAKHAIRAAKNPEQRAKALLDYDNTAGIMEIGVLKQRSGETETAEVFVDEKSSVLRSYNPFKTRPEPQETMDLNNPVNERK